jgi:hypothetical protein
VDYIESRDNSDPPGQPVTDEPPSRVAANPSG